MDSHEVKVCRIRPEDPKKKNNAAFNGYIQRNAFVVMPKIDKFRQEKLELKRQTDLRSERNQFTKMRIVAAGEEVTKTKNIYFVN
jgi:hypothetical protein